MRQQQSRRKFLQITAFADNPLSELAESVGYIRGALAATIKT